MKVGGAFSVGILLILLLGVSSSFAQEYEDVVYLKNGGVRRGMIIEQVPGESVKLKTSYREIYVINVSDISRIVKEEKKSPIVEHSHGATTGADVKLENWYTYWGLGFSSTSYTDDLRYGNYYLVGWPDDDSFSMGFDFFGFYWPLQNQQTILGGVYNASTDRRSRPSTYRSWEQWVSGQFSVSAMHFIQSVIGEGPFVRADLGWGFLSGIDDNGNQIAEDEDKSGPAALFGVGYGFPVGAGGTRILLNVNYALRSGIKATGCEYDSRGNCNEISIDGGVRALSITVGGLF